MFVKVHNKKSKIYVLKDGILNPKFNYTYQCNNSYSRFENGVMHMYSNIVGGYSGFTVEGIPKDKYVAEIKVKCIYHKLNVSLSAGVSTITKPVYNANRNNLYSQIVGIPLIGATYELLSQKIDEGFISFWIDTYGSYSEYEVIEIKLIEVK